MGAIETSHRKTTSRFNVREKRIKLFSATNAGKDRSIISQICVIRIPSTLLNFFSGRSNTPVPILVRTYYKFATKRLKMLIFVTREFIAHRQQLEGEN